MHKELFILLCATYMFWHPTPVSFGIDRADWFWLLGLFPVVMAARWVVHQRFWTPLPIDGWIMAFIALCLINIEQAPYTRGMLMLGRPLLGIAWLIYLVELARTTGTMRWPFLLMTVLGGLIGFIALGATGWDLKSSDLFFIIERLPRLDTSAGLIRGGFNPNEISGAMTWLTPLAFGMFVYASITGRRLEQWIAGIAFAMLISALMLAQSRSSIFGTLPALALISIVAIPRGRWQVVSLGGIGFLLLVQVSILLNFFPQFSSDFAADRAFALSARDVRMVQQRMDMWESAYDMVSDYPLTGVGMSYYRHGPVRERYPVPNFDIPISEDQTDFQRRLVPHAHNEFVQIAADLGIPGFLVFLGWNLTGVYMAWFAWRRADENTRILIISATAGLVAHGIFSMTDAIPLWDRFHFIYWMMVGLLSAHFMLVRTVSCYNS